MTPLKIHALALAFPEMDNEEYAALKADIKAHGQIEPIVLLSGEILDGRHRYLVCSELGIEPSVMKFGGGDPVAYVQSINLRRRHLTPSQRAAAVVACNRWHDDHRVASGAPVKRVQLRPVNNPSAVSNDKVATLRPSLEAADVQDVSCRETPKTNAEMAKEAAVSERTITDAKLAHKAGLSDAVRDGAMTVAEAATVARGEPVKPRKPAKATPAPEVVVHMAGADEGELAEMQEKVDFLAQENTLLTDRLAVHFMDGSDEEKAAAAELIASLRAELAVAAAENDAMRSSRDGLLQKCSELEKQVKAQRRQIDRLEKDMKAAA